MNLTLFRTIRLIRLLRLARLLKLPVFKELRLMIQGLLLGAKTLFWSIMLVCILLYPAAYIFRETLGEYKEDKHVRKNFENIAWSWFTILRCVVGDCSNEA